jgi:lipopolysaccharide transport system ATP-binding protein
MKDALKVPLKPWTPGSTKPPPVSVSCRDLTLRFPVYGVDAKSLKKRLAAVTVGGRLGSHAGVTDVTALSHVNLELKAGDRLGLVGHNGSGKTTLLRALSGAYEPDEGQVEVQGRIAALLDLNLGIDASATGFDNIRLRGRIAGLSSREIEGKLDEIAEFTGLGPFLAMPVKTYSAGMQARLAFAAATAVEADILLMDEWIAVGDAEFQKLAHKRLLKLVERAGVLVLASHDHDLLRLYCNKVMRLDGGSASPVADIGQLDELLAA